MLDCLVVGGGPAGLTAALYLARFHLDVSVYDTGESRAATIPRTHNHAGFPDGIVGAELVGRMRDQAVHYGAAVEQGMVERITREGDKFLADIGGRTVRARSVLLATGVKDRHPDMPAAMHAEALDRGLLRYCPICDGYEVTDRRIAVLGSGEHGRAEALFLLSYTADVTLIAEAGKDGSIHSYAAELGRLGVRVLEGPVRDFRLGRDRIAVTLASGPHEFDSIYPAFGCDSRTELGAGLGAERAENGALVTDAHQRTTVPGLYAAGDVVEGINQIGHAMGQAAVAATAIRNALDEAQPIRRSPLALGLVGESA